MAQYTLIVVLFILLVYSYTLLPVVKDKDIKNILKSKYACEQIFKIPNVKQNSNSSFGI